MSTTPPAPGSGRLVIVLIAGIPLTMILAASWLWFFVVNGDLDLVGTIGTANHGSLVEPPRQLSDAGFVDDAGAAFRWGDVEPRWTMVAVIQGPHCDHGCERRLYTMRQIHIALGREFDRIRRAFVSSEPIASVSLAPPDTSLPGSAGVTDVSSLASYAAKTQRDLLTLSLPEPSLASLFPEVSQSPAQWYLVDPAGWVMMRFDDEVSYKEVIADLKFLLKNSGG